MGDTDQETLSNVTACDVDFDDDCFDDISNDAKQFIMKLLSRQEKWVLKPQFRSARFPGDDELLLVERPLKTR